MYRTWSANYIRYGWRVNDDQEEVIAKFRSSRNSRQFRIAINPRQGIDIGQEVDCGWRWCLGPIVCMCASFVPCPLSTQRYSQRWAEFSRKVIWFRANANTRFCTLPPTTRSFAWTRWTCAQRETQIDDCCCSLFMNPWPFPICRWFGGGRKMNIICQYYIEKN